MRGRRVPAGHLVVDDLDAGELFKACWERGQLLRTLESVPNLAVWNVWVINYLARLRVLVSDGDLECREGIEYVELKLMPVSRWHFNIERKGRRCTYLGEVKCCIVVDSLYYS